MRDLMMKVLALAHQAGDAIMVIYAREFEVTMKADHSPVTEADQAAHNVIIAGLAALEGDLPILSEEATAAFTGTASEQRYWLVDPLDGTKEFIKRNDEFTVNIALIDHGQPVLGVVFAPALGIGYCAAQGEGAFKIEQQGDLVPIRVAGYPSAGQSWRVMASRSREEAAMQTWLKRLGDYQLVPMGSSLKLCLIAEGAADVYPRLGPTCLWDTAAAHAVVAEAGGRVVTLTGTSLSYSHPQQHLNPHFVVWGH
ncbi:3'(2'),5'-bisphosphate nucleotidase CysQ [Halomonas sp. SpR8]|uniref:3'(2'),5'-bisphosphate nucleotidase CysQ n=1 Tax=Halomonas sp. SpR8 TaxID=3050463 RepID=UPI0027E4CAF5|nr:3'(2'),5'-bisphosphate nucleotidase CysQ [Halomonas sp. SpR8]MDQ7727303.1 3'(2'),5'-bisphosphate nucleotidase CysQ [Halomonas sp. SpR8]